VWTAAAAAGQTHHEPTPGEERAFKEIVSAGKSIPRHTDWSLSPEADVQECLVCLDDLCELLNPQKEMFGNLKLGLERKFNHFRLHHYQKETGRLCSLFVTGVVFGTVLSLPCIVWTTLPTEQSVLALSRLSLVLTVFSLFTSAGI